MSLQSAPVFPSCWRARPPRNRLPEAGRAAAAARRAGRPAPARAAGRPTASARPAPPHAESSTAGAGAAARNRSRRHDAPGVSRRRQPQRRPIPNRWYAGRTTKETARQRGPRSISSAAVQGSRALKTVQRGHPLGRRRKRRQPRVFQVVPHPARPFDQEACRDQQRKRSPPRRSALSIASGTPAGWESPGPGGICRCTARMPHPQATAFPSAATSRPAAKNISQKGVSWP